MPASTAAVMNRSAWLMIERCLVVVISNNLESLKKKLEVRASPNNQQGYNTLSQGPAPAGSLKLEPPPVSLPPRKPQRALSLSRWMPDPRRRFRNR
jgi:hypothetical protein